MIVKPVKSLKKAAAEDNSSDWSELIVPGVLTGLVIVTVIIGIALARYIRNTNNHRISRNQRITGSHMMPHPSNHGPAVGRKQIQRWN